MAKKFSLVLCMLEKYQPHIPVTLSQLAALGHEEIWLIISDQLRDELTHHLDADLKRLVKLVLTSELNETENFRNRPFTDWFTMITSLRLFYVGALMEKARLENVIHVENDVLLYYNCDESLGSQLLDCGKIWIPFDSIDRNVCSVMYIPNSDVFRLFLSEYPPRGWDMGAFAPFLRRHPDLISALPIYPSTPAFYAPHRGPERAWDLVTKEFPKFGMIFDGVSLGQYIGGIDPIHTKGVINSHGFINETCVIFYSYCDYSWHEGRPFIQRAGGAAAAGGGEKIPIFNLHIHCKDLQRYAHAHQKRLLPQ